MNNLEDKITSLMFEIRELMRQDNIELLAVTVAPNGENWGKAEYKVNGDYKVLEVSQK